MTDTTKLIKELVGLAVEKSLKGKPCITETIKDHTVRVTFYERSDSALLDNWSGSIKVFLRSKDAPAQLQAAIDKVKAL